MNNKNNVNSTKLIDYSKKTQPQTVTVEFAVDLDSDLRWKKATATCMWPVTDVRGKAVPLQAWSGPEGSRKLRFPDYMTTAQDGGKVVSLMHRPPLPTGNIPGTHFC